MSKLSASFKTATGVSITEVAKEATDVIETKRTIEKNAAGAGLLVMGLIVAYVVFRSK